MKLLLVDDNQAATEVLQNRISKLSGNKVTVLVADTLSLGTKLAETEKPDVILLDLILPDSPDWQKTITHIHDFEKPVIVVTALDVDADDFEIRVACLQAGARRVYSKPLMNVLWPWVFSDPIEEFAARILGEAGRIHLRTILDEK